MFKRSSLVLAAVIATASFSMVAESYAKGFSSSRSSFSSSSSFSRSSFRSSSSSWGSSKSSSTSSSYKSKPTSSFWGSKPKTSSNKPKSTGFASNKVTSNKSFGANKSASMSGYGKKQSSKTTKAVMKHKAQQNKFKQKPVGAPISSGSRLATKTAYNTKYRDNAIYNSARTSDRRSYWDRRDRYYGDNYQPPVYVYNSSPSFGMWDTIFLYSMLNNANAGSFAHNHQNDPGYVEWRKQADELAKTNEDLKMQLAKMDASKELYKGQKIDPSYLPNGIDADIALSDAARSAALPELRFSTGNTNGAYFATAAGIYAPALTSVILKPLPSAGSGDNINCIANATCDMAYVQRNMYWNYVEHNQTTDLPFTRVATPMSEAVHMFCRSNGPSDIKDLTEKHKVWFPVGSGAEGTWMDFVAENPDYGKVQTSLNNSVMKTAMSKEANANNDVALLKVIKDNTYESCMMYVGIPAGTEFLHNAERSAEVNDIVLVDINDGKLDNTEDPSGADVYDVQQFDTSVYPNLTRQNGVIWGSGDVDTLFVKTDIIVSDKWRTKHTDKFSNVQSTIQSLIPRVREYTNSK